MKLSSGGASKSNEASRQRLHAQLAFCKKAFFTLEVTMCIKEALINILAFSSKNGVKLTSFSISPENFADIRNSLGSKMSWKELDKSFYLWARDENGQLYKIVVFLEGETYGKI